MTWRPRMYRLTFLSVAGSPWGRVRLGRKLSPSRLLWFHWWCSVFLLQTSGRVGTTSWLHWSEFKSDFGKAQVVVIKARCAFRIWWPGVPVFNELFNAYLTYVCAARSVKHSVSAAVIQSTLVKFVADRPQLCMMLLTALWGLAIATPGIRNRWWA